MKHPLPGEYTYRDEVLPILIIGIAFNLATSFIVAWAKGAYGFGFGWYLGIGHLFQDTSGTCFAALVLGPWWGAIVGVVSSTLNTFWISQQFGDAFAYTCVQIGLALAWGYAGRIVSADEVLVRPRWSELGRGALAAFIVLLIAGALTASLLADLVKATLLEKAGGDFYQGLNQQFYAEIEQHLRSHGIAVGARVLALAIFDSYANILDKGLSLIIALVLARTLGSIPSAHTFGTSYVPVKFWQRVKVGADSIFWFMGVYSIYLLISWFVLQDVHFMYSPTGTGLANWMQQLAALLLFPYPIALIGLAFFALNRKQDAFVETSRASRLQLYDGIRGPTPWSTAGLQQSRYLFVQQNSGYGLVMSLIMWPVKSYLLSAQALWIYFFGMSAISLLFVYERRESLLWFRRSQQWQRDAEVSFALNGGPTSATGMIALFHEIVGHDLIPCPGGQIRVGQMTIQVGMNCARSGWLEQVRDIREFDQVLVIASDSSLDVGVMDECLRRMKDEADVGAAIVLYPANEVVDVQQLRNISRTSNCSLIIVGPSELGELIRARAQDEDLGAVLSRSRVSGRFAEMLATGRILPPCLVTSGK